MRSLREPAVRDLAWLLLSADVLCARTFPAPLARLVNGDIDDVERWLVALDRAPAELDTFLAQNDNTRLGHYAERLLHFHLRHDPDYRLLAAGLQIRAARGVKHGGATLGECDFLVEHPASGALLHWELAVKFYLQVPVVETPSSQLSPLPPSAVAANDAARWVGPNLVDSLAVKMDRLVQHQLRLTDLEAARAWLPRSGPWLPQAIVKGWLFHPLALPDGVTPDIVSPHHARGWWATLGAWERHARTVASARARRWACLPHNRWLAPARMPWHAAALDVAGLRAQVEAHWMRPGREGLREPLMVVALAEEAGDGLECERGFIVPDGWLARARRRVERARHDDASCPAVQLADESPPDDVLEDDLPDGGHQA